jgi:ATP-dependent RNA helicase DDX59
MQERRQVLKDFLTGSLPIVVATGVLGRGLDLLRVTQVIIFDFPHTTEEYIHQIGRASRLGAPGTAMVFINTENKVIFKELVGVFQKARVVVPKELLNSPYAASSYAAAYNPRKRKTFHKDNRGLK